MSKHTARLATGDRARLNAQGLAIYRAWLDQHPANRLEASWIRITTADPPTQWRPDFLCESGALFLFQRTAYVFLRRSSDG